MFYHNHNVAKALIEIFPNIDFKRTRFQSVYQSIYHHSRLTLLFLYVNNPGFWDRPENRRKFFEIYAQEHYFSPTDPENWYSLPKKQIIAVKVTTLTLACVLLYSIVIQGARSVLKHHLNSVSKALLDLFPDIGLDKTKFQSYKSMSILNGLFPQTKWLVRLLEQS